MRKPSASAPGRGDRCGSFGSLSIRLLALLAVSLVAAAAFASVALGARGPLGYFHFGDVVFGGEPNPLGRIYDSQTNAVNESGAGGVSAGDIYVGDAVAGRIQQFSASGDPIRGWGSGLVESGPDNANEVQAVRVDATGGTFTLAFGADTTGPIPASASAAEVQAALNDLGSVSAGGGSVSVSGGPGDAGGTAPYLVSFDGGPRAGVNQPQIVAASGGTPLSGGAGTVTVATTQQGDVGPEICQESNGDICNFGHGGALGGNVLPRGIAIDQTSGDLYVNSENRVEQFSATGQFIRAWGDDDVASGPDDSSVDQEEELTVRATGGTFTLTFQGETTAPIPYNAPASGPGSVAGALDALAAIGGNYSSVEVTGGPGDASGSSPYVIAFHGLLGGDNLSNSMEVSPLNLTGASEAEVSTAAVGGAFEICEANDACKEPPFNSSSTSPSGNVGFTGLWTGIGVAPAGAPNAGDVLVSDSGDSRVEEFTAAGAFVRMFGFDVDKTDPSTGFEVCTAESGHTCQVGQPGAAAGQFTSSNGPGGIKSVVEGSDGAIYTLEGRSGSRPRNLRVQKFTPAGGLGLTPELFGTTEVQQVTVNATAGQFRLGFDARENATRGSGDVSAGSAVIANVTTNQGHFTVGQPIGASVGCCERAFPNGAYIVSTGPGTITVNTPALASESNAFLESDLPFTTGTEGSGDLTSGSTTVSNVSVAETNATGEFLVGQEIGGAGIPAGTTVVAASGGTIELSQAATASATGVSLTADLPYDAPASVVQSALNSLPSINGIDGGGSVSVSGGPGDGTGSSPYVIAFDGGHWQRTDPVQIAASSGATPLSGGSGAGANEAVAETTTPGGPGGVTNSAVSPEELQADGTAPVDIAIGPGNDLLVAKFYPRGASKCANGNLAPFETRIMELSPSGVPLGLSEPCAGIAPTRGGESERESALSFDQLSGRAYLFDSLRKRLYVFGTPGAPPDLTLDASLTNITPSGGTISGTIDPNGPGTGYPEASGLPSSYETTYRIEFKKSSASNWTKYTPDAPIGSGSAPIPFSVGVNGLAAKTSYDVKVVAVKPFAPNGTVEATRTFTTLGAAPQINAFSTSGVTENSADLHALINPQGTDTSYHFEYGTTASYGQSTPDTDLGESLEAQPVQAHIEGLQDTTYHFRVVAENSLGTTRTEDQTFTFHPPVCPNQTLRQQTKTAYLPDCRAYELVSPEDSGGTTLFTGGPQSAYATNPPRLTFTGDFGEIPGAGKTPINTTGDLYVATRGANGWKTRYVGPAADEAGCVGGRPMLTGGGPPTTIQNDVMSDPGLDKFIDWNLGNPLECVSADFGNIRFSDLNTAAEGSNAPYLWNAEGNFLDRWPTSAGDRPGAEENFGCPQDPNKHPFPPHAQNNVPVGYFCSTQVSASGDLDHFVFSTQSGLFGEGGVTVAPGSAYDNDTQHNTLHLISKLPGGGPIPQEPGSQSGPEELIRFPHVSTDGSRILMGTGISRPCKQENFPLSGAHAENAYCPIVDNPTHLYMRVDDAVTYDVSADSQGIGQVVSYVGSTPEGSKVYFTTGKQMTADDTDHSTDLYMWSENGGNPRLTLVSAGTGGAGNKDNCVSTWTTGCGVKPYEDVAISKVKGNEGGLGGWSASDPNPGYTDNSIAAESGDILFYSPEQLVAGKGTPGKENVFDFHAGSLRFVATLEDDPYCLALSFHAEFPGREGGCSNGALGRLQVTRDGHFAAFITTSQLTAYDNEGHAEMYRYDAETEQVACMSCKPDGSQPHSEVLGSMGGRFITDDGRVFFDTEDSLVPRDTNEGRDTYEFVDGRPQLITTGTGNNGPGQGLASESVPGLYGVSADGTDVYFGTLETLVGQDRNGTQLKFYDARSGGGFSFVPPPPPCQAADECHGATSSAPTSPAGGTQAGLGSGGNQRAGVKERHKRRHKRHRHHRHAKRQRAGHHHRGGAR